MRRKFMKVFRFVIVLVLALFALNSRAVTPFEGTYDYVDHSFDGKAELVGWTGTMEIRGDVINRSFTSPDGSIKKFYNGTLKQDGNIYILTITDSHKKEYIGNTHRNVFTYDPTSFKFTLVSEDGKFKETWKKHE